MEWIMDYPLGEKVLPLQEYSIEKEPEF